MTAASFGAKYASKKEVYRFLTNEVRAYLSGYETMTVWHMRDLCSKQRRRIHLDEVKHIIIPQFEGLSIDALLDYGKMYPEVMRCLPAVEKEIRKLPREYIGNVIYTIVGDPFNQWV